MGKTVDALITLDSVFSHQVDGKLKNLIFQRAGGQHRRHWGSAEGGGKDQPLPFKVSALWQCLLCQYWDGSVTMSILQNLYTNVKIKVSLSR